MSQQTTLGFYVSLKESFSIAAIITVINKDCKGAVIQIATVFWPISRVVSVTAFWNRAFQTFIQLYFSEPVFPEIHQLWGSYFFGKCLKLNIDSKNCNKKLRKIFLFLWYLHLNWLRQIVSLKQIMLVIDCQSVNKQS